MQQPVTVREPSEGLRAPEERPIRIRGAREHNLKNIDLELPRNAFIVITGLSGSGKSSLAFDTIYAEGQRRYVESLSAYARQFLGQMEKPDVDRIEGLSPAISIEQRTTSHNPRSTVGTTTEIYDYLRLLYARAGTPHCYKCDAEISQQSTSQMVEQVLRLPQRTRILVLAPIVRGRKGEHRKVFEDLSKQGFVRMRVDGEIVAVDDPIKLTKTKKHTIEVVIDRLTVDPRTRRRLSDSLETAVRLGNGLATVDAGSAGNLVFSQLYACPDCGTSFEELAPRMFSFNSPYGACSECNGLGKRREISLDLLIPDASKSINEGAIEGVEPGRNTWSGMLLRGVSKEYGIDLERPFKRLSKKHREILLYGTDRRVAVRYKSKHGSGEFKARFEGLMSRLMRRHGETTSTEVREKIESFMRLENCAACDGKRLRPESLAVRVGGRDVAEVCELSIRAAMTFFDEVRLQGNKETIAEPILKEVRTRLRFLNDVGLSYLTLSRSSDSLSGGEAQRIRLATQIGSRLVGVLYILDEPSIGLHHRDNRKLIHTLRELQSTGNTVMVVEHDMDTILEADHVVDLGPGAGEHGGYVVAIGTPEEIMATPESLTGQYLAGQRSIPAPERARGGNGNAVTVRGARANNLKNLDVDIPLGKLVAVTGVSGSGKSTLVDDILYRALARHFYRAKDLPGEHDGIDGLEHIDKVIDIDQSPIGRTPRSNPATYTGTFSLIRDLFGQLPESRMRGYKPGRFSFNVKGGRCEACDGDGIKKIEMHFLPDVYVRCEVCKGRRYNDETLEVLYKGHSIADVLEMTVEEAHQFLQNVPSVRRKLETLESVGLGYIRLGQPATTLSGGEAQRVKLATELSKVQTGRTLYLLDEPTTGLHFEDVKMLLAVLNRLVDKGNTVLIIEHNPDVIKVADHIIDLGPEGGDEGGRIVAAGSPRQVARVRASYTGQMLRQILGNGRGAA
ncbi:MAG: excinuclease ABC subunit UvrA [Candidatus Latescibacterota bacterium]|nr:MAG: excinuclease ABC subunit UvrA [Candidatus Latescibacterota bacterium]